MVELHDSHTALHWLCTSLDGNPALLLEAVMDFITTSGLIMMTVLIS